MECMLDRIHRLERCLHSFQAEFNFKMKIVQQLLSTRSEQLNAQQKSVEQESSLYKFLLTSWGDYNGLGQSEPFHSSVEPLPSTSSGSPKRGVQPRRNSRFVVGNTNSEEISHEIENSSTASRTEIDTTVVCKTEVQTFPDVDTTESNNELITPDASNIESESGNPSADDARELQPLNNQILIQSSEYNKDGFEPEEIEILPSDNSLVFIQAQDTRMDEGVIIITDDEEQQTLNENSSSSVEMKDDMSFRDMEIVQGGEGSSSSNFLSDSESSSTNTALVSHHLSMGAHIRGFGHCHRERAGTHPHPHHHGHGHGFRHRPSCSQTGFMCHYCGRNFSQSGTLNQHKKLHLEGNDLRCHLCEDGDVRIEFPQLVFLVQHMKNHHGIERQTCELCSKDFAGPTYLKRHMCLFHGENGAGQLTHGHVGTNGAAKRNKQCSLCPKRYQTRADLLVHIRKHTGEKPYFCSGCQRHFADTRNLRRHQERFPDCKNANQSQSQQSLPQTSSSSSISTTSTVT